MVFRRRTPEEKAARREHSERFRAEARQKMQQTRQDLAEKRDEKRKATLESLNAMLQPDEVLEATLRSADVVMKKDVLFTSRRVIVASTNNPDMAESIPYRSISGFATSNFVTNDITLAIIGRRDKLDLRFDDIAHRDRAVEILNKHAI